MNEPEAFGVINEITRRQWLLRLGELVALAGVSGLVPDASTFLFASQEGQTELPPGLYVPSSDALVHALSTGHKPFTPPAGSETDYAVPVMGSFTPQFFSAEEFRVITRLSEILLGNVDATTLAQTAQWIDLYVHSSKAVLESAQNLDPLHRALAVTYFGESSVKELETVDPQRVVREGLAELSKFCSQKYGEEFLKLDAARQSEVLRVLSASEDVALRNVFELIREQAIRGYYTSPAGLHELDYKGNAFYGECPGCEIANKNGQ